MYINTAQMNLLNSLITNYATKKYEFVVKHKKSNVGSEYADIPMTYMVLSKTNNVICSCLDIVKTFLNYYDNSYLTVKRKKNVETLKNSKEIYLFPYKHEKLYNVEKVKNKLSKLGIEISIEKLKPSKIIYIIGASSQKQIYTPTFKLTFNVTMNEINGIRMHSILHLLRGCNRLGIIYTHSEINNFLSRIN